MRTTTLILGFALALSMMALAPGALGARELACTDTVSSDCDGIVCLDSNLDGRYQWDECEPRYCTCPPPRDPW
jgi:hypothetical protein